MTEKTRRSLEKHIIENEEPGEYKALERIWHRNKEDMLTTKDLIPWHKACAQYNETGKFCLNFLEVDKDNYGTNYIEISWDEEGKEKEC